MIKATVSKNENGVYNKICMKGHAEYADPGQDIVCSAVSVLLINTANAIEQFTDDHFVWTQDEKKDLVELQLPSQVSQEAELLMKTLVLGLRGIEDSYGREFIQVHDK